MTFDRITFDPAMFGGRPCVRGMRMPVSVVLAYLADGATTQEILGDHPELELEDVQQCLGFAAWLASTNRHAAGG